MKKINVFQTTDNNIFINEDEACNHQKRLYFDEWYTGYKLFIGYDDEYNEEVFVEKNYIYDWLIKHKKKILIMLEN